MSFTLSIKGKGEKRWSLSNHCLEQIEKLRAMYPCAEMDLIFGDAETRDGTARNINRAVLLEAIGRMIPMAMNAAVGFEVRVPFIPETFPGDNIGRGAGVIIAGINHVIMCVDDYWYLQLSEGVLNWVEPVRRYEPAEIDTQMGLFKVERKKLKGSDLSRLMKQVRTFLKQDHSEIFEMIWG